MSQIPYRPDIDGLRAVAVLSVLIYHAGFSFLPGGFMGVDIFFVISGYLITSFIVKDLAAGSFSMVAFWERRARRILPPLFAVIAASVVAGWFIFLPLNFMQLAKEMISQGVFGSNFLFLKQGGYFDTSNDIKVLLHTWSLAVEEQFYLFFPIGVFLWWKFIRRPVLWLLIASAVLSFILCMVAAGISEKLAFYMLPFRGWGLLAGAIVAVARSSEHLPKNVREGVSAAGLGLIAYSLLFYSGLKFPDYIALASVIGTSAIIWANGGVIGRILSNKPMVAVGLISYSLYLWHWPIMAYARYLPILEFDAVTGVICIALSIALAAATYFLIEQPVRKRHVLSSRRAIFLFSLAGLIGVAGLGCVILGMKGFPDRYSEEILALEAGALDENPYRHECDQPSIERIKSGDVCQTNSDAGKPDFIVWGDSHADAAATVFYDLSKTHGRNGYVVTAHGCPPIIGGSQSRSLASYNCNAANDATMELIKREGIKEVFLIANWGNWLLPYKITIPETLSWYDAEEDPYQNLTMASLAKTIDVLKAAKVRTHVVYNVPFSLIDPPRVLALEKVFGITQSRTNISLSDYQKTLDDGIATFRGIYGDDEVDYIEPESVLCDAQNCYAEKDGRSLYFNPGHLSTYGAKQLEPLFEPYFKK